jgi:outer membrane protein TolC
MRTRCPVLMLAAAISISQAGRATGASPASPSPVTTAAGARPPATPATQGAVPLRLSLVDAVGRALARNPTLSVRKLDPEIARARVLSERGAFDDALTLDVQRQHTERPTGSQLDGAQVSETDTRFANLGMQTRFREGTAAGFRFNNQRNETNSRFQTLNPNFTSNLVVNLTQPILRGSGARAAAANLAIARNGVRQSGHRLARQVQEIVATVEKQYWDLVFARRDRDVKRFALQAAEELLEYNRERQRVGLGSDVQIVEAQATEAARAEDLEIGGRLVADAQEVLRRLTAGSGPGEAEVVPLDEPAALPAPVPLEAALVTAHARRPDYRDALLELASKKIRARFLANQRLPRLDLVSTYGYNGLANTYADALDQVTRGDFPSYTIGFQVELNLENRAARGAHRQGIVEKRQAVLAVKALEDQIDEEVARAVRAVETDLRRVDVSRRGQELSARQLAAAEARYREGLIANFDLLRFQQDLASARSRALRAVVDVLKSRIDLDVATGTLLDGRGIVVERVAVDPSDETEPAAPEGGRRPPAGPAGPAPVRP